MEIQGKRFCVLQITPEFPNPKHHEMFFNRESSDFYFVTYKENNPNALKHCPNTVWSETRNTLAQLVPKVYDYYMFIDHDIELEPQDILDEYHQVLKDLELNPAVLTYYPGRGLHTPYAQDFDYLKSRDYSCIPFTHNGIKIVHKSLMNWFFPLYTKFRTDTDACHMFNIQEIPFLKDVVCSHKMIHHNDPIGTTSEQIYNKNGAYTKSKMDEMWSEIRPYYKKLNLLIQAGHNINDSLSIKNFFVALFRAKNIIPRMNSEDVDFYKKDKFSRFFDIENPLFDSIK
mgnify:CR=1 FL=1